MTTNVTMTSGWMTSHRRDEVKGLVVTLGWIDNGEER